MNLEKPTGEILSVEPQEDGSYGDPYNDSEAIGSEETEQTMLAYFELLDKLREQRDRLGRSERARYLSIAVTDLETSMLRYKGSCDTIK